MCAQEAQQLAFLGGEFGDFVTDNQSLLLGVEGEFADFVHRYLLAAFSFHATENGFDTEHELFHRERFGDVVVGTDFEAFEDIVFKGFGGKEYDGYLGVHVADFRGERETVLLRHHDIKDADVVFSFKESLVSAFTVDEEVGVVAFCLKVLAQKHAEVLVVFAQEDSHAVFHSFQFLESGSMIINFVPTLISLSTLMVPPSSSTILRT